MEGRRTRVGVSGTRTTKRYIAATNATCSANSQTGATGYRVRLLRPATDAASATGDRAAASTTSDSSAASDRLQRGFCDQRQSAASATSYAARLLRPATAARLLRPATAARLLTGYRARLRDRRQSAASATSYRARLCDRQRVCSSSHSANCRVAVRESGMRVRRTRCQLDPDRMGWSVLRGKDGIKPTSELGGRRQTRRSRRRDHATPMTANRSDDAEGRCVIAGILWVVDSTSAF